MGNPKVDLIKATWEENKANAFPEERKIVNKYVFGPNVTFILNAMNF